MYTFNVDNNNMQKAKVTELRANLPDFIKKVMNGEEIQITLHGKSIARIIPEVDEIEAAQERLNELKGTVIQGDIISPIESEWTADADNL